MPALGLVGLEAAACHVRWKLCVLPGARPHTVKVLDALAWGLPVVTTLAGVEGIKLAEGTVAVAGEKDYFATLVEVLKDPQRRLLMAKAGRADVLASHRPEQAAAARLALIDAHL